MSFLRVQWKLQGTLPNKKKNASGTGQGQASAYRGVTDTNFFWNTNYSVLVQKIKDWLYCSTLNQSEMFVQARALVIAVDKVIQLPVWCIVSAYVMKVCTLEGCSYCLPILRESKLHNTTTYLLHCTGIPHYTIPKVYQTKFFLVQEKYA